MVTEIRAVWISRIDSVKFLFVGVGEERSLQKKMDARDEFFTGTVDAALCIKKAEDQLR